MNMKKEEEQSLNNNNDENSSSSSGTQSNVEDTSADIRKMNFEDDDEDDEEEHDDFNCVHIMPPKTSSSLESSENDENTFTEYWEFINLNGEFKVNSFHVVLVKLPELLTVEI
jgi:hypothetical protein